jgi:polyisoprenoid-binding protein YceI
MGIESGSHEIGPSNGSLKIHTKREGAAGKMGHDLVLDAKSWGGTVEVGDNASIELHVDPNSIEVESGSGGAKPLTDKDKSDIKQSTSDKVLGSSQITFQSTDGGSGSAKGDLSIAGSSDSVNVPLQVGDDGTVKASITLSQSNFGIKQFKAMMGALKVSDTVQVEIEAKLPTG